MEQNDRSVWTEYDYGFELKIAQITQDQFDELRQKFRKLDFEKKSRRREWTLDEPKFYRALFSKLVRDWRGLTELSKAAILGENLNGASPKQEVAFDKELLYQMSKASPEFFGFLDGISTRFEKLWHAQLAAQLEGEETKNS